jgi:homoserine acetyltransferase
MPPRQEVRYWDGVDGEDQDASMEGWYVVDIDAEGSVYDATGPYDTEKAATDLMTEIE